MAQLLGRHLFFIRVPVFYPGRAVEYIWLCANHGHHRVASPGFELGSYRPQDLGRCPPGTIWANSSEGTRRATVWVKVPSSNPRDVTHNPISVVTPLTGTVRWYGWAPEHKRPTFMLGRHLFFIRVGPRSIFGSVPVMGIIEWPPQDSNLGSVGLKAQDVALLVPSGLEFSQNLALVIDDVVKLISNHFQKRSTFISKTSLLFNNYTIYFCYNFNNDI